MSAPSMVQIERTAWMDYEQYFDADPINGIIWHPDAPKEAIRSFSLYNDCDVLEQ